MVAAGGGNLAGGYFVHALARVGQDLSLRNRVEQLGGEELRADSGLEPQDLGVLSQQVVQ